MNRRILARLLSLMKSVSQFLLPTSMPHNIKIRILGAAGTVTGSKYLIQTAHKNILVDCGLFQGLKKLRLLNWSPFPVNPGTIDLVLLTHGHLDHAGYLPRLVKAGFAGA